VQLILPKLRIEDKATTWQPELNPVESK